VVLAEIGLRLIELEAARALVRFVLRVGHQVVLHVAQFAGDTTTLFACQHLVEPLRDRVV
jgi:hypothetical protein